jgi:phosphodiesterase/alkaline phosphatase D-like protein
MKRAMLPLVLFTFGGFWFATSPAAAQFVPSSKPADRMEIRQGPEIELNHERLTIIRWTSNNPGGSPEHYAVVHYGTDPKKLNLTAKSHIRLNPSHDYTVFRVRMDDLPPKTTYYYTIDSEDASGVSDGVKSSVNSFTTP